ncbi:MAG: hypothetical protein WB802_05560, partial [Candidatus Dormiibacterota bacterium]
VISDRDESLADLAGAMPDRAPAPMAAGSVRAMRAMSLAAPAASAGDEPPIVMEIAPQPVELSETMTVVFELVDPD